MCVVTDTWEWVEFTPAGLEKVMPAVARALRCTTIDPALRPAHISDAGFLNEFFAASTRTSVSFLGYYMEQAGRDRLVLSFN